MVISQFRLKSTCSKPVRPVGTDQNFFVSSTARTMAWACVAKRRHDWVKRCMEYEVEGSRPRRRSKRTWREVVQKGCQARKLNREDALDRSRWKKLINVG